MTNEYDIITEEMNKIEELAEQDIDCALKKMVNLYFRASKVFNHEVCNAIDLWMYESITPTIIEYLNIKIKDNDSKNTQFKKWIR